MKDGGPVHPRKAEPFCFIDGGNLTDRDKERIINMVQSVRPGPEGMTMRQAYKIAALSQLADPNSSNISSQATAANCSEIADAMVAEDQAFEQRKALGRDRDAS